MNHKEFNECLKRLREGDKNGLAPIFDEYYKKLVFYADTLLPNLNISEDIVSPVLLKILRNPERYGYIKNPTAWLHTVVKNEALDHLRKHKNEIAVDKIHAQSYCG